MRLVVFAIIFTVISTHERSWAEETILKAKEIDEAKQELRRLPEDDKVDLILKLQSDLDNTKSRLGTELNNTKLELEEETNLRRKLQCTQDFRKLMEELVSECYPEWATVRKKNSYYYDEDVWRHVLLNIEHWRVLHLKIELHKANVSEKTFIEIMEYYSKLRKRAAHDERLMHPQEREEVFLEFLKTKPGAEKVVLRVLFNYSYRILIDGVLVNTDDTVINKITQDTEEQRESYRLLQLPKFNLPYHGEEFIENAFIDFVKILNGKQGLSIQTCAFFADEKAGAFILFDSFNGTYETWKHMNDFPKEIAFQPEELDDIILTTVSQNALFKNLTVLNITSRTLLTSDLEAWDYNKVISEVKNILANTEIESCLKTQEGDSVHIYYKKFESTLVAYQKMKEVLRSQKVAAELSIINATTVNQENLIPVDIKG
ncbi:uncharacterized protein LOC135837002 [Planococcus citri]|uniref:uncharacterized protein LOC135837002 n=1 Tax=Planococcus citri TaxID=170843 RepID=UPI0031F95F33